MQSQLDKEVLEFRSAVRAHEFESLTVDGESREYCKRCGQEKKSLLLPDSSYTFRPCRGLVG